SRKETLRNGPRQCEIVGMADASRLNLDKDLSLLGTFKIELDDLERLGLFESDGGARLHFPAPVEWRSNLSSPMSAEGEAENNGPAGNAVKESRCAVSRGGGAAYRASGLPGGVVQPRSTSMTSPVRRSTSTSISRPFSSVPSTSHLRSSRSISFTFTSPCLRAISTAWSAVISPCC